MKREERFFTMVWIVGAVVSAAALLVLIWLHSPAVMIERVSFDNGRGQRLVGDLYLPRDVGSGRPAVLLCHGVEVSKEIMAALGVEFARRGFAALAFDYGGYGESDRHGDELELMVGDTRAALDFLLAHPSTQGNGAAAAIGHSMGVHYSATLAADDPRLLAVVGMGNNHQNPNAPPNNLALFMGAYEEFHTLKDLLESVRESAGKDDLQPNQIAGKFSSGTARALIVSPWSEHGIEPMDPFLIARSVQWIDRALPAYLAPEMDVREPYRLMARAVLVFSGAALVLGLLLKLILPRTLMQGKLPPWRSRLHVMAVAAAALAANLAPPPVTLALSDLAMALLLAGGVAAGLAYAARAEPDPAQAWARARRDFTYGGGVILIIIAVYIFSIFIVSAPQAHALGCLGQAPAFLFHATGLLTYEGISLIRGLVFHRYSEAFIPGVILAAVIVMESWRPGLAAVLIARLSLHFIRAVQVKGPFRIFRSKYEVAAAGVVMAALAYVLYARFQEGWLVREALGPFLLISLKAMILPFALFIAAINLYHRRRGRVYD